MAQEARQPVHLQLAFGRVSDLEIEFIAVVSGASPYGGFLAAAQEGLRHVRNPVRDLAAKLAELEPQGFASIWSHATGPLQVGPTASTAPATAC